MEGPEIQFAEAVIDNGRSAPAPSASRPAASPSRPPAPPSPTSTARRRCCRHHGRQAPEGPVRLLPADDRRRGADVRGRQDPRLVLPPRGPPQHRRHPHLPPDRPPAAPAFVKGLRNEVQVVITVLSLHPDHHYDVLAINAASMSTQLSGLPFSGPIGGVRVALIDGQWVAFPNYSRARARRLRHGRRRPRRDRRRRLDDVAIMMVEAEATETPGTSSRTRASARRPRRSWPQGLEAAKPFIAALVRGPGRAGRAGRQADPGVPDLPGLPGRRLRRRRGAPRRRPRPHALQIADKQERESRLDEIKAAVVGRSSPSSSRVARRSSPPRTARCRRS